MLLGKMRPPVSRDDSSSVEPGYVSSAAMNSSLYAETDLVSVCVREGARCYAQGDAEREHTGIGGGVERRPNGDVAKLEACSLLNHVMSLYALNSLREDLR